MFYASAKSNKKIKGRGAYVEPHLDPEEDGVRPVVAEMAGEEDTRGQEDTPREDHQDA